MGHESPAQADRPDSVNVVLSWLTMRSISHDEARDAMQRLVNSCFNNPGSHARFSIPAEPDRDDDLVLSAYIEQQRRLTEPLSLPSRDTTGA